MQIWIDNRERDLWTHVQRLLPQPMFYPESDPNSMAKPTTTTTTTTTTKTKSKKTSTSTSSSCPVAFVSTVLPLGDVVFVDAQGKEVLLMERKTHADLMASIQDGRYDEQSYRLHGSPIPDHHIVYLLEGNVFALPSDKQKLVRSTLFSLSFFKGFSVYQTLNTEDTAQLLIQMADKWYRDTTKKRIQGSGWTHLPTLGLTSTSPPTSSESSGGGDVPFSRSEPSYASVIKKVKKENISKDNIGEIMLTQIPGLGATVAAVLMQTFGTLPRLIQALQQDPTCCYGLYVMDSNGKKRKMNQSVIQTLVHYFGPNTDSNPESKPTSEDSTTKKDAIEEKENME